MKKKSRWDLIRREFIKAGHHSGVSLRVISENFNVPYQSVRRKAATEKWHNKRLQDWYEKTATNADKL